VRKPPGVGWEPWVEKQIRDGMARGEFDDLPGTGKPLPGIDEPHDELWWVREKLKREEVSYLPPQLEIRVELDAARAKISRATTEADVRRLVADINARIRHVNMTVVTGPPTTVMPLDVEDVLERWRQRPCHDGLDDQVSR